MPLVVANLCAAVLYMASASGLIAFRLPFQLPFELPQLPGLTLLQQNSSSASSIDPQTDAALHEQLSDEQQSVYYVYDQLNESDQEKYRIMLDAFQTREAREYPYDGIDELSRIRDLVMADHPEFFDIVSVNAETTTFTSLFSEDKTTTIQATYDCDAETSTTRSQQLESAVGTCLAGMPAGLDDYGKAKYLYEYIALNVSYDWDAANALAAGSEQHVGQTAYDALVSGRAVCGGYARAFQHLAQRAGLQCEYVTGTSRGAAHAWNVVRLNGAYYHVDPTQGDPQFVGEGGESVDGEAISYDYLGLPESDIALVHTIDDSVPLPACTSMQDNYFVRENAYLNSPNVEHVGLLIQDAFAQGRDSMQLRCADRNTFDQLLF